MGLGALGQLAWTALAFIGVVVLAAYTTRILSRRLGGSPTARLQVVEQLALGRDRSLVVVRVEGRLLLVGATAHGISLLADLDPTGAPAPVQAAAPPDFGGVLEQSLHKLRALSER